MMEERQGNGDGVEGALIKTVEIHQELFVYDRLPRELRRVLQSALFKYSAQDCREAMDEGMPVSVIVSMIRAKDAELAARALR